ASDFLDRFAEPVVGPTTSGRSRWLAMTKVSVSELIVHAGAQEIGVERHVVIDESGPAIQSAIEAAEIDIEILDLGRPVLRSRSLQSGAHGPATVVAAGLRQSRRRCLDIAEGAAASDERHESIRGIAEAPAHRGKPGVARLATQQARIVGRAIDA